MPVKTIVWSKNCIKIIDQTKLPARLRYLSLRRIDELWYAIRTLQVRGAPAIGIAAALGVYLGVRHSRARSFKSFYQQVEKATAYLATARPTAVNLFWALERMRDVAMKYADKPVDTIKKYLLREAIAMIEEDHKVCKALGDIGASLLKDNDAVLTHCNAGGLATAGYGTALAIIYRAVEKGKRIHVFVDETRPLLQGARLTTWELKQNRIPVTLICDNMAACLLAKRRVNAIVVGADRVVANGDFANKIGTYNLALLAHYHAIPFYVAAPLSSFDISIPSGDAIPIEQRDGREITHIQSVPIAARGIDVYNPAFDITPHKFITAIVTEKGIIRAPFERKIKKLF
jgi:methylthioribose-1-phosphate isomerase